MGTETLILRIAVRAAGGLLISNLEACTFVSSESPKVTFFRFIFVPTLTFPFASM